MTIVLLALAAQAAIVLPDRQTIVDARRDNQSVAQCQMRANAELKEFPDGPRMLFGFQFDPSIIGSVSRDAIRLHDPNSLMSGRQFETVRRSNQGLTLIATDAFMSDIKNSTVLGLFPNASRPEVFTALIEVAEFGQLHSRYSGTCIIKAYAGAANAHFAALKKMPPMETPK